MNHFSIATDKNNYIIEALAGTGKTYNLVKISDVAKEQNISTLMCAFNNRIVEELASKVQADENLTIKTLHAIGLAATKAALKSVGAYAKTSKYDNFFSEKFDVVLKAMEITFEKKREYYGYKKTVEKMYSIIKFTMDCLDDAHSVCGKTHNEIYRTIASHPKFATSYFVYEIGTRQEYEVAMRIVAMLIEDTYNVLYRKSRKAVELTFDNMIFIPAFFGLSFAKFDLVLIDECQDLSKCTRTLVLNHISKNGKFVAVGDRNQAIMRFAGADTDSFDYLESLSTPLRLSMSYRCSKAVASYASELVPDFTAVADAPQGGVYHNSSLDDVQVGDMVLSRKNKHIIEAFFELLERGIDCTIADKELKEAIERMIASCDGDSLTDIRTGMYDQIAKKIKRMLEFKKDMTEDVVRKLPSIELMEDAMSCVFRIIDGFNCTSKMELEARVAQMFSSTKKSVLLCSIHRSKGLEANRVFHLNPELLSAAPGTADEVVRDLFCLDFVARTRAKVELHLVSDYGDC